MLSLCQDVLDELEPSLKHFEAMVPAPKWVRFGDTFAARYIEKKPEQAVVLKLVAAHNHLRAALVLARSGFYSQQAMLQRSADEANEDILYIALGRQGTWTKNHERLLTGFWAEEFGDHSQLLSSHQSRDMVQRRSITGYIADHDRQANPEKAKTVMKVLHKVYSGYVHGAAPHLMELYGGGPPHFHLRGMCGTPRETEFIEDIWNYVFRTITSHVVIAKMFGRADILQSLKALHNSAAGRVGMDYVTPLS